MAPRQRQLHGQRTVMLLKVLRIGGTSEFSDYRTFSVSTDTKVAPPM